MAEETKRPFRATDVLTGASERAPKAQDVQAAKAKRLRKQVTLHLTYAQIQILDDLYHRLNAPDMTKKLEKSELGGLAIEVLNRLLPKNQHFADTEEMFEYLSSQILRNSNT